MLNFVYDFPIKVNIASFSRRNPKNKLKNYITNPVLDCGINTSEILSIVQMNSNIKSRMLEFKLPIKICVENLENIRNGHLKNVYTVATKIYDSLPEQIKQTVDLKAIQDAAILHDYGKILIPSEILYKKGKLNSKEQEIMELHSEFSYELLKNKGLSDKTLNLIKYHHQDLNKKGYPKADNDFNFGIEAQILSLADKYSALREKRCYKNALGKFEALEILAKEVTKGNISQEVYTALIRSV